MNLFFPARWTTSLWLLVLFFGFAVGRASGGDTARVLPHGETPQDARLKPLKDLNGYFPFQPPATKAQWERRAQWLRRRILVATGLWPMPEKTPLRAVIHGKVTRPGFTVEKVYFQSYPGHFVTGLLYRPSGPAAGGKHSAVLCPHGHGGRLQDYGAGRMAGLIASGAEKHENSGRYPKLARCAQLARMGCVVFIFDMLGYADSVQISRQLAHRFSKQREDFNSPQSWGFFSTQAEMRLQTIMGLQTYNSIRALDFLCSLPDVDKNRVGVTGGSGGGTQTILLCAIDPRPIVAFPQGMVSTAMQGGCTCENCSLLRIGSGNVELTALLAPKPQGMTAANDWTKEMMTKGYPQLQQLYELYGAKENVFCKPLLHFPHNYNYATRQLMYHWFNKHLGLGFSEPIIEEDFEPLTSKEWTVWNDDHPAPEGGDSYERSLTKYLDETSRRQLAALAPRDLSSWERYREVVGGALDVMIGRSLPPAENISRQKIGKTDKGGYWLFTDLLTLKPYGEQLPVVSLYPKKGDWNKQVVIWIDGQGKSGLFDAGGSPRPAIQALLDSGAAVISADLLFQGEFLSSSSRGEASGQPLEQRVVSNPREYAGYTFTYNHPLLAQRAHDILTLISFVKNDEHGAERIDLVGVGGAAPSVAAARVQAGEVVGHTAVDTQGFRFVGLKSYRDPHFLSGAVKYGDLPGMLSLTAPGKLWITGEDGKTPETIRAAYRAAGAPNNVTTAKTEKGAAAAAVAKWLSETR